MASVIDLILFKIVSRLTKANINHGHSTIEKRVIKTFVPEVSALEKDFPEYFSLIRVRTYFFPKMNQNRYIFRWAVLIEAFDRSDVFTIARPT